MCSLAKDVAQLRMWRGVVARRQHERDKAAAQFAQSPSAAMRERAEEAGFALFLALEELAAATSRVSPEVHMRFLELERRKAALPSAPYNIEAPCDTRDSDGSVRELGRIQDEWYRLVCEVAARPSR
jgi:hypothetical protein